MFIDTARIVGYAEQSRVTVGRLSVVCLSRRSIAAVACGGFAAEHPGAGDIDQQRQAASAQSHGAQQHGV